MEFDWIPKDINWVNGLASIASAVGAFLAGKGGIWLAKHGKLIIDSKKTIDDFKKEQVEANKGFQTTIDLRTNQIEKELKKELKSNIQDIREETDRKLRNFGSEIDFNRSKVESLFERLGKCVDDFDYKMKGLSENLANNSISKKEYYEEMNKIQADLLKQLGDVRVDVATMSVTLVDSKGNSFKTPDVSIPDVLQDKMNFYVESLESLTEQVSGIDRILLAMRKEADLYEQKNNKLHDITKKVIDKNLRNDKESRSEMLTDFSRKLANHKTEIQKRLNNFERSNTSSFSNMNRKLNDQTKVVNYLNEKLKGKK